jgi:transposase
MDLAGYVINAVLVEGKSVREVCQAHAISRSWLYELIGRYRQGGDEGLKAQSKRPRSSPARVAPAMEEEIVALRKELSDLGVDAGAHTIAYHLQRRHRRRRGAVPSVATIWRVLSRRELVNFNPRGPKQIDPEILGLRALGVVVNCPPMFVALPYKQTTADDVAPSLRVGGGIALRQHLRRRGRFRRCRRPCSISRLRCCQLGTSG